MLDIIKKNLYNKRKTLNKTHMTGGNIMRYGMNINKLAEKVADDFKNTMAEEGFKNFAEMKKTYWWEASDIRSEMLYIAQSLLNEEYERDIETFGDWEKVPYTVRLLVDDEGHIQSDKEYTTYRDFKKLVMGHLK